ncbi:uncharacterized protein DDB_G0286175-like [Melanaphis sacchari]|uniref:uncharacterized protein DDB_G0286175-like n=1 Tax=Melanaphis sacchari TaxID=742174 RepID=UPI000DC14B32|nr:uncharacterized protein DDB_G0286175-like [Melanaphis sacchari]
MNQVVTKNEVCDLSENDNINSIINSTNVHSAKFSGSDNRRLPAKKRQIVPEEHSSFENECKQVIPNAKTNDHNNSNDDNYYFLMSLLPSLREVPKNRNMAIRNKLQRVFVEEQETKNCNDNDNNNINNNNCSPYSTPNADQEQVQVQSPLLPPQYPYPNVQHPIHGNVNCNYAMAMPLQNAATTSMAHGEVHLVQPTLEYANNLTGQQQLQQYINANNNIWGYNPRNVGNNTNFAYQPEIREQQTFTYL